MADPKPKRAVGSEAFAAVALALSPRKSRTQAETSNWYSRRSRSRRLSNSVLMRNWNTEWERNTIQLYYIPYSVRLCVSDRTVSSSRWDVKEPESLRFDRS